MTASSHGLPIGGVRRYLAIALLFAATAALSITPHARGDENSAAPGIRYKLIFPNGLAIDRDGGLVISDIGTHQVVKLGADGRLTLIAGTGKGGYSGDGGPAVDAQLHAPMDVAIDRIDGSLLVADTYNHCIRRIDSQGRISTIVGRGRPGYSGDGGPATEASLDSPQSISQDGEGNLFIADTFNHVVRRVDRKGVITTFAGTEAGLAGDGGPANKAQISLPMAVAVAPSGDIYISDAGNSRIRRVAASDGTIETIAGFGLGSGVAGAGFEGDGGPATKAKLFSAADLKFGPAAGLYISDSGNNRIRLSLYQSIMTIAGSGTASFSGDEGAATAAAFNTPQKVAIRADGVVFVADRANGRVRSIDANGVVRTVAGEGMPAPALTIHAAE